MSFFYRLTIQYDGTHYLGWQKQTGQSEKTIQGELERALLQITNQGLINTIGSGRTDAGVHALAQVVRIETAIPMVSERLVRGGNALLPEAIKILSAEEVDANFHPIFSAKSKEYIYLFAQEVSPYERNTIAKSPRQLDIDLMRKGCEMFLGEHDFKHFFCTGTPVKSTVRTIFRAEIIKLPPHPFLKSVDVWQVSICGSGFLKQMVRLLVGSLWQLGLNKITLDDLQLALAGEGKGKLGAVAPACGLYLKEVHY